MVLTLSIPTLALAASTEFKNGTVVTVDKNGYDKFIGTEITANNSSTVFNNFLLVADNKTLNAWYINVVDDINGVLEVAYKVGSNYSIVTFAIDGPGKYWIADSKGSNGANMVKVGSFNQLIHEHDFNFSVVVTNPTCIEDGFTTYTCQCGENIVDDIVPAPGHNYQPGNFSIINDYYDYTPGNQRHYIRYQLPFTCTGCGDSYNEEILVQYVVAWHVSTVGYNLYHDRFSDMTYEEYLSHFDDTVFCIYSFDAAVWEYSSDGSLKNTSLSLVPVKPWDYTFIRDYSFNLSVDNGFYDGVRVGDSTRLYDLEINVLISDPLHLPVGRLIGIKYLD
jgi:hypothetical protein